jgi:hypothetical protein
MNPLASRRRYRAKMLAKAHSDMIDLRIEEDSIKWKQQVKVLLMSSSLSAVLGIVQVRLGQTR